MMIYVGQTSNLVKGKYKDNIVYAMQFWIDVLGAEKEIRDWLMNEIKTSTWKNQTPEGMPKLSSVTWTSFKSFLIKV
jgi:hypothetical protein